MNRELRTILIIVAGATVLVLVALAFLRGSTETTVLPPVDLPPPGEVEPATGVIVSTREDVETSWFGLRRGATHYLVTVQFYAPPACSTLFSHGDPWPVSASECATDIPISGVVSGSGIAPTGETIVTVDVEVEEDCFAALAPAGTWPPTATQCT